MCDKVILVVEDEPLVGLEIQEVLTRYGYRVPEVLGNSDEVLQAVQNHKPDLLLMDIRIDGSMDGIATAAQVKKNHELPVVFLTAFSDQDTLKRAAECFPDGYILKPFDERALATNVEMALLKTKTTRYKENLYLRSSAENINSTLLRLLPDPRNFQGRAAIDGFMMPNPSGSGDIYDAFYLTERHLVFYSLDVMGHGTLQSLMAYNIHDSIPVLAQQHLQEGGVSPSSKEILESLHAKFFPRGNGNLFFTISLGILDCANGQFNLTRAGHPPALLLRADGTLSYLHSGGMALGAFAQVETSLEEINDVLNEGDRIILYSDGVVETLGGSLTDKGYTILKDLVSTYWHRTPSTLAQTLKWACTDSHNRPRDDLALLILEYRSGETSGPYGTR